MNTEIFYKAARAAWAFNTAELEELVRRFDLGHLKLAQKWKKG